MPQLILRSYLFSFSYHLTPSDNVPILKCYCLHCQMICGYFTTFSLISNIKIIELILWIMILYIFLNLLITIHILSSNAVILTPHLKICSDYLAGFSCCNNQHFLSKPPAYPCRLPSFPITR